MKTIIAFSVAAAVGFGALVSPAYGAETCTKGKTTISTDAAGNTVIKTHKVCTQS